MPEFEKYEQSDRIKLLLVGDAGAGKTGLLATLANAGYNLRIIDLDNKLRILRQYLTEDGVKHVRYATLVDKHDQATAYNEVVSLIFTRWKIGEEDLGHISTWGPQDILVIDSMTMLGEAAKREAMKTNGKSFKENLSQADWGCAQRYLQNMVAYINSNHIKCHIIVITHLEYIDESGTSKAYPNACGRSLNTKVARYFENVVRVDTKPNDKRVLRTKSDFRMDLMTSAPKTVDAEEEYDLAKLFAKLQGVK